MLLACRRKCDHGPRCRRFLCIQIIGEWGIASRLLDVCERITFQRGYENIGLCVYVKNHPALNLYARRGYRDAGWEPYLARGVYTDANGGQRLNH